MIDALIVDDEAPARRRLRELLTTEADLRLVGESNNVSDALIKVKDLTPQVLFLDVRMPGLTGLDLLARLGRTNRPLVIFTTAYANHAQTAFEFDALDYLMKPIERERCRVAVEKARRRIRMARAEPQSEVLESEETRSSQSRVYDQGHIGVRVGRAIHVIELRKTVHIVAAGDYLDLYLKDGRRLLIRERLHSLEGKLVGHGFLRINRSTLINELHVSKVEPSGRGEFEFTLSEGSRLMSAASYHDRLFAWLGKLRSLDS
jgi:two-component system LytT family response regulator